MKYSETLKILGKQIEILAESAKICCQGETYIDHFEIYLGFCDRICETSKLITYSLSCSGVGENYKELNRLIKIIDDLACIINEEIEEKPLPFYRAKENQALCLVIQASTNIKRLLTMTSGSRIRYDDEAEIGNGFSKDLIDAIQSAMEVAQTHKLD